MALPPCNVAAVYASVSAAVNRCNRETDLRAPLAAATAARALDFPFRFIGTEKAPAFCFGAFSFFTRTGPLRWKTLRRSTRRPGGRIGEQAALGKADAVDQDHPEDEADQARRHTEPPIEFRQI